MNRVRAGSAYVYDPVPIDRFDPPHNLTAGDVVRVKHLPGCPAPNTMGHAHVVHLDGSFGGLVHVNSLLPMRKALVKVLAREEKTNGAR